MKNVTVALADQVHTFENVDVVLDLSEDALFVFLDNGASITFRWSGVEWYTQEPAEEAETDD